MLQKLKSLVSELSEEEQFALSNFFEHKTDVEESTIDAFYDVLELAYTGIKEGAFCEKDVLDLFSDELKTHVSRFLTSRLKLFKDFAILRTLEKEKKAKAEVLVDTIWKQFVIRYNPNFEIVDMDGVSEDEISGLMDALDFLSEYCVSRTLTYDAIVDEVKDQTDLSQEMCDYIARKIDRDYSELRLNYIVKRLRLLEKYMRKE